MISYNVNDFRFKPYKLGVKADYECAVLEHSVARLDDADLAAIKAWEVQHGYCRADQLPD